MNVSPILSLPADTSAAQAAAQGGDFQKLLRQATAAQDGGKDSDLIAREKEANQAATGLVSHALILPILQQVRRSFEKTQGPFSPGKAENTFGPQFDMQLADRIAQSPKLGIKTALANRLMRRGRPAAQPSKELNVHG
jgi:hypothetical protein